MVNVPFSEADVFRLHAMAVISDGRGSLVKLIRKRISPIALRLNRHKEHQKEMAAFLTGQRVYHCDDCQNDFAVYKGRHAEKCSFCGSKKIRQFRSRECPFYHPTTTAIVRRKKND